MTRRRVRRRGRPRRPRDLGALEGAPRGPAPAEGARGSSDLGAASSGVLASAEVLRLQHAHGNAYVQRLLAAPPPPTADRVSGGDARTLAREPSGGDTEAESGAPEAAQLIAAQYPHLASVLGPDQLAAVQVQLNARYHNLQVDEEYKEAVRKQHKRFGAAAQYDVASKRQRQRIAAKGIQYGPGSNQIEVPAMRLFAPEVFVPREFNVAAEMNFRHALAETFSRYPVVLTLMPGLRPQPMFRFHWGPDGWELPQEGGLITWDHLMAIPEVSKAYFDNVTRGPVVQDLLAARKLMVRMIDSGEFRYWHLYDMRSEQPRVTWVAERLGAFRQLVRFLATEGESPLQVDLPSFDIWTEPRDKLNEAFPLLVDGKVEPAAELLIDAERLYQDAYRRLLTYQYGAMAGAGSAVFALEMVKMGSMIAVSVMSGNLVEGGILLSSAGAGAGAFGATALQNLAQQGSEIAYGLREEMAVGDALTDASADAISMFVGYLTGGAFTGLFEATLGQFLVRSGLNPAWAGAISDVLGGTASSPITTIVNIEVDSVIRGSEPAPQSMGEFWRRIVDDLWKEGVIDVAAQLLTRGTARGAEIETGGPKRSSMADVRSALADEPFRVKESNSTRWHQEKWKLQGGAETEAAPTIFEIDGIYYVDNLRLSDAMRAEIDAAKSAASGGGAAPPGGGGTGGGGGGGTKPGMGPGKEPGRGDTIPDADPGRQFADTDLDPHGLGALADTAPRQTLRGQGPGKPPAEPQPGFEHTSPGGTPTEPGIGRPQKPAPARVGNDELREIVANDPGGNITGISHSNSPRFHQDVWEYLGGKGKAPPAFRVLDSVRISIEDPRLPRDVRKIIAPPRKPTPAGQ